MSVLITFPASTAFGFALTQSGDAHLGLDFAIRWPMTENTSVDTGARGLGGGLEYAIDDQFCNWMQPHFAEEPTPTCEEIREAVGRAFSRWGADHPDLNFVDVSDDVQPRLASRGSPTSGGAEIDVFASKRFEAHNPRRQGSKAFERTKWTNNPPLGTNGKQLRGSTITGSDIVVDTRGCWYIDPELTGTFEKTCSYLPGLMMHEIGHALGLGHPFESSNYHSGDDPTEPIEINCQNPKQGLDVIDEYDATAIMAYGVSSNYFHRQLGHDRARLRPDDLGGRNFLYPVCDETSETDQRGVELPGALGVAFGIGLLGFVRRLR